MTELIQRPARFSLIVSVLFLVDDVWVTGQSVNVSESGLLVDFEQPLDVWTNGELSLTVGDYILTIGARVARAHERNVGLSFFIDDENDRKTVRIMMEFATATSNADGSARVTPDTER